MNISESSFLLTLSGAMHDGHGVNIEEIVQGKEGID